MIRLIVSDLDGTLLKNGAQELPEGFIELVKKVREMGIGFAVASGRQYQNIRRLFAGVEDDIYYIAENGAYCRMGDQVIFRGNIEEKLVREIIEELKKYPDLLCLISKEECAYIEGKREDFIVLIKDVIKNDIKVVEDLEQVEGPCLKIAACDFSGKDKYFPMFRDKYKDRIHVVTSGNMWFDFVPSGVNKGVGLEKMLEVLGMTADECMAFGDERNDLELLVTAGWSYAMDTASDEVKAAADHVTGSVQAVIEHGLENDFLF